MLGHLSRFFVVLRHPALCARKRETQRAGTAALSAGEQASGGTGPVRSVSAEKRGFFDVFRPAFCHQRHCFLFACYTGFRFSDLNTLSQDNIVIIKGRKWIVKKPFKTLETSSIVVRIPIYSIFGGKALQLIDDYGSVEKLCHIGHNSAANRTLKELLKMAGISEERHITFHVARHTCATLLLSQGVPITSVQSILGHTKITTTQIYAKLIDKTLKKDIEKAFKK